MRNFKIPKLGCIALMLFIAADRDALAGKEDLATSMNDEVATEGGNQVGIGKFFKLPFHVSVSVRGGYDDNVISQTFNPQGSAFVEANLGVTYAFGNSRTQLSLQS